MAGAASFYGFVSLFPLLLISAAIASRIAGDAGIETVQSLVNENFPGLDLNVGRFYERADTIGAISVPFLIFSGLRWVDAVRAAVRSMWGMDDQPGNFVVRKLLDMASLAGLGLLLAASWATSVVVRRMAEYLIDLLGVENGVSTGFLEVLSWVLSVGVNTLLFAYLLVGLPRITVPFRHQAMTALFGAVAFEILKTFLVEYVVGAGRADAFGTFAIPLVVIAWIYIVTRLLMVLAALTAESAIDHLDEYERTAGSAREEGDDGDSPAPAAAEKRPGVTLSPSARQARSVGVAAGVVLGAAGTGFAVLVRRAARTLGAFSRRDNT
nr:YihY/virulence factor BrkB family protein [Phytoactinopolyspora mesophila]